MMTIASCFTCSLFYSLTQAWSAVNPLHWKECEWGRPTPMAWNLRALPRALRILNSIHSYSFSPNETVQDRLQTKNPRATKQWPFNGFGPHFIKCCPTTLFSNIQLGKTLAGSLARQTYMAGRLTWPADSLCLADSLARQTHLAGRLTLPGRLTCPADSLARQTHLPGRLTCPENSLARQTHLPDATADDTSLNKAHVLYQEGAGGSYVEKPAETQTISTNRLASPLIWTPYSRSGFVRIPVETELGLYN